MLPKVTAGNVQCWRDFSSLKSSRGWDDPRGFTRNREVLLCSVGTAAHTSWNRFAAASASTRGPGSPASQQAITKVTLRPDDGCCYAHCEHTHEHFASDCPRP